MVSTWALEDRVFCHGARREHIRDEMSREHHTQDGILLGGPERCRVWELGDLFPYVSITGTSTGRG